MFTVVYGETEDFFEFICVDGGVVVYGFGLFYCMVANYFSNGLFELADTAFACIVVDDMGE